MIVEIDTERLSSDRRFGFFFSGVFFVLAIYFCFFQSWIYSGVSYFVSFLLILVTLTRPYLLRRPKEIWLRVGNAIGYFVNPVVCAILFIFLIFPYAISFKIIRRDALMLRQVSEKNTYWKESKLKAGVGENFSNPY